MKILFNKFEKIRTKILFCHSIYKTCLHFRVQKMVSIIHSENPKEPDQRKSRLPKKIHRTKELTKDDPEDNLITNGDVQVTRSHSQARSRSKIRNAISGVFSHFRSKSRTSLDSRSSTPGLGAESPKYFKFFSKKHQKVEQNGGAINSDRRQVHWQRSVHNISCTDSDESVIETPRNSISVLNLNHVTMDREVKFGNIDKKIDFYNKKNKNRFSKKCSKIDFSTKGSKFQILRKAKIRDFSTKIAKKITFLL
jgi:hypothetical protein